MTKLKPTRSINTNRTFSQNMWINFEIEKFAILVMYKRVIKERKETPDQEDIKTIGEKESY